jgi:1-acyl-sn-glycerol-3-phosphate acyltransferase
MNARPGDVLRSLAFYVAFYGGTLLYVGAAFLASLIGRRAFLRAVLGWSRYHRGCVTGLLGIRVAFEGELPHRHVLIAMTHESFFVAIDGPNLVGNPAIFAKAELLRIPLWGWAATTYGLIPVEREQGAKALRTMLAAAKARLAEGRPLVIFPEGTRVPHGEWPDLRSGFAGLYKLLGLPVVPAAIDSGPCYHRAWKRRGTITIKVGEAIPPGLPRAEVEARVHAAINALNVKPG